MRKRIAAIIACILALSLLSGCMEPWFMLRETYELFNRDDTSTEASALPAAKGDYFDNDVWRGDVDFSEMNYEHYDISAFDAYIDSLNDIAKYGGSYEEFDEADNDAVNELYYIYTLGEIMDLQYTNDPSDEYASTECLYTEDTYDTALDEYRIAMKELAASSALYLIKQKYQDWQVSWFENYEAVTDEESELYDRESELEQKYDTLMAADARDTDAIGKVFVELVGIRNEEAQLVGYDSYAEYAYSQFNVRDYSPADSKVIWQTAKDCFAPLIRQYADSVYNNSNAIYYSDEIDCSPEAILKGMRECLPKISPELYDAFKYMEDYGLYNISSSDTKIDSGYTTELYYYNEPYITNCPYGTFYDYTNMFHEFGHFANMYYVPQDLIFGMCDNDLSELQSQGMEIIFMNYYDELFGTENGGSVRADVLLNLLYSVVDGAMYDEFQQRVYAEKDLTPERVSEIYAELYKSYGYEPYSGYETEWMDISHNFSSPFYYISYSVSAIAALEIYQKSLSSYADATDVYLRIEAMDGEALYLSEALESAGLRSVFDVSTSEQVAAAVKTGFEGA